MKIDKNKIKKKLLKLPSCAGVYFFYDKNRKLIYIGKASVLKHRVNSYFHGAHDTKTEELISRISSIEYRVTDSVIEALILESNLIKKHQPKYNIRERDDKSFIQIGLTREDFPRFLIIRPTETKNLSNPNGSLMKNFSNRNSLLIKNFSTRPKKDSLEVKKYWGPYTNTTSVKEMLSILRKIFSFRDCTQNKFKKYKKNNSPCLFYPLNLCPAPCCRYISKSNYQKIVKQISQLLDGKKKRVILSLKKQMLEHSKNQNYEEAAKIRNQITAFAHINDVALIKQERSFEQIKNIPYRIEAYDISNIGDKFAVGSMVVFTGGEINKSDYRKFRIKNYELGIKQKNSHSERSGESLDPSVLHQDDSPMTKDQRPRANSGDPQMMASIIDRRFNHTEWPNPDLIILDGGKGQLSAVLSTLRTKKVSLPIIAVAKGPTRKGFALFKNNAAKNIVLDRKFIESIRDESHRFAITYHRKLKNKI